MVLKPAQQTVEKLVDTYNGCQCTKHAHAAAHGAIHDAAHNVTIHAATHNAAVHAATRAAIHAVSS